MKREHAEQFGETFDQMVDNVEKALLGKTEVIRLALTTLLSGGHLLLEDDPGTGKTLLARSIANTVKGTHRRIQFTPDLLPSDVTGVSIWDQNARAFEFQEGPIFATIVLADEINRASPKTQSALLEVMEEGRITVDGETRNVVEDGEAFMVIATQNRHTQLGTYPLPEAQLDRFMMRMSIDHPDHEHAVALLADAQTRDRALGVEPMITSGVVHQMGRAADSVHIERALIDWVVLIAEETRRAEDLVDLGVSSRGCLSLVRCARTWAASKGRNQVRPDDIKALVKPVMEHRIVIKPEQAYLGRSASALLEEIMADHPAPEHRD